MALKKNRTICLCNGVTEKDILRILKKGARDLGDVKKFTLASASCGRCKVEVEAIITRFSLSHNSDLQQYIDF